MKKKCGKNYFKGPKMAAKDDATILFAATILTAPTVEYIGYPVFYWKCPLLRNTKLEARFRRLTERKFPSPFSPITKCSNSPEVRSPYSWRN